MTKKAIDERKEENNSKAEKEQYAKKIQYTSKVNGEEIVDYQIKIETYDIVDAFALEEKLEDEIKKRNKELIIQEIEKMTKDIITEIENEKKKKIKYNIL